MKVGNESVSFTIACRGEAGSCAIESSLITTEKLKGNKITALAAAKARQSKANVRSKKVTVGSSKVVIAVGHARTITIRLNSTGRKLLAKFKKLPARLTVALVRAGKKTTIISQSVNVKPAKKRKAASKGKARGASGLLAASPLTPRIYVTAP